MRLMQYAYHVNHDILLLRNHVDDIEQVLFSSKLGLLSGNILTEKELTLIQDLDSYQSIKITVAHYRDQIIIILRIPQFSDLTFSRTLIEPIPDINKKALLVNYSEILVDQHNTAFEFPVKDDFKKNLIPIKDNCINDIINSKEAYCKKQILDIEVIKLITEGIIITKNLNKTILKQNCNNLNLSLSGNYLIKFNNCKIELRNVKYENKETKIYDKIILPNFVTKIKEEKVIENIKLEELYLKHISNRELVEEVAFKSKTIWTTTVSINIVTIIVIATFVITKIVRKYKNRTVVEIISAEPQSNGGGVTVKPII